MKDEKDINKLEKINILYTDLFNKLRKKVKTELILSDDTIYSTMKNRGHNHEYYVSMMVSEKRKLKDSEAGLERLLKKLTKHYMSPAADISAKTITEAKEYALKDSRYLEADAELGWRRQIVDYLTEINKLLTKQYFTVTNILDFYKLDSSNMATQIKKELDD